MRTALSALALSAGLIGLGISWPAAAAAQPAGPDEPVATASDHVRDASAAAPPSAWTTSDDADPSDVIVNGDPDRAASADDAAEPASDTVVESKGDQFNVAEPASDTVAQVAQWALESGDTNGLPFVIIDKHAAEVFVYDAAGRLKGAAPALLGSAVGDHSAPGVGDRELSDIPPKDRTTPAGRFIAAYGPAYGGKSVLWVDYTTAISMHPVIFGSREEHRLQRLQSPTPDDNRITFGCINVPAAFYRNVVDPAFKKSSGVVYILPETTPADEFLPALQAKHAAASATSTDAGARATNASGLAPSTP